MSNETKDKRGVSMRDFLGLAIFGAAILSASGVLAGTLRIFKRFHPHCRALGYSPKTFL